MSLSEQFGSFTNNVMTEWNDRGHHTMTLIRDFGFKDPNGKFWHVPAGAEIDGASIPRFLWSLVGAPFVGNYRNASVVHDYFCQMKNEPWKDVHKLFHQACLASGVGKVKARVMYWAVFLFGPRWPDDDRDVLNVTKGAALLEALYRQHFPKRAGLD